MMKNKKFAIGRPQDCKARSLFLVGVLILLSLVLVSSAKATTYECDSCSSCNSALENACSTGDIIIMNQSINTTGDCIDLELCEAEITFDCQGYTMEGDYEVGEGYIGIGFDSASESIIKNCVVKGFQRSLVLTGSPNNDIFNNTFIGIGNEMIILQDSALNNFYNNSFLQTLPDSIIFYSSGDSDDNNFYNNVINTTIDSESKYLVFESDLPHDNSFNDSYGGNYWFLYNGTGYSNRCINDNNDTFCDIPFSVNSITNSNNTDYLPLTTNFTMELPTTIQVTIHEPQNTTYPEGNLSFNATANDTAVAICLSTDGNITYPICSYSTSALSGYVADMEAGFYNFTFRANNTFGEYDWDIVFFTVLAPTPPTPSNPLRTQLQYLVEFLISFVILMAAVFYGVNEMMKEKPDMNRMIRVVLVILIMVYITAAIYQSIFVW